jgi:hypothetical protein
VIIHPTVAEALVEAHTRRFHDAAERRRLLREARRRRVAPAPEPEAAVLDIRDRPEEPATEVTTSA